MAGAVMAGCGALHSVTPSFNQAQSGFRSSVPDLSTKNYVAMFPVVDTPNYIAAGSDRNLWFTGKGYIAKITVLGVETYHLIGTLPLHIAAGQPGSLWFTNIDSTNHKTIGKIATSDGTITLYFFDPLSRTSDIAKGPDGNMWFTDQGRKSIGKITPAGVAKLFALPSAFTPVGIVTGPDGKVWFSAVNGSAAEVGNVTTGGVFKEFALPNGSPMPGAMTKGPDNVLYATSSAGGLIAVTTAGAITIYPTSFSANFEDGIAVGPDKQIWISPGDAADDLVEFNTHTHMFSKAAQVPVCKNGGTAAIPRGLALGPNGDMWFVTEGCAYVGEYEESLSTVGIRLTGEASINKPPYGFELGYFNGTTSRTSETVALGMGESVVFQNVDTVNTHTASFLGDATATGASWPGTFNGSSTQSPANTPIGTTGFSTGPLNPGASSLIYETGLPGFYMMGCAFHYDSNMMRTVIVVH